MVEITNPLRLELTKRLTTVLEEITTANGYAVNLGPGRVHRGRLAYGQETPTPSLSILEVPIPPNQQSAANEAGLYKGMWDLTIQGWAADDRINPTDPAQVLLADVKKRLGLEGRKKNRRGAQGILGLGDTVLDLIVGVGVVRPPEDISPKAYFWLSVTLEIVENITTPYEA